MRDHEPRWLAESEFRQRCWDGETMVYLPKSGETHCLNALAASVLGRLAERAMTASELAALLQSERGNAPSPQEIATLLRQFDELGLISPLA